MPSPVNGPGSPRAYRSVKRQLQAEGTRLAVLHAARDLFLSRGYRGTTIAEVARLAKVSPDTLYASVGRKPQLLLAVHDMVLSGAEEPLVADQRAYVAAVRAAVGARAKLATYAEALGQVFPTTVPLAESLRVAAQGDDDCREVWEGLNQRRAENMLLLARDLRATGDLRDDLSDEDVAHLVWTTNSPEFYLLTTARGRTPEHYVAVVTDLWIRTLLA